MLMLSRQHFFYIYKKLELIIFKPLQKHMKAINKNQLFTASSLSLLVNSLSFGSGAGDIKPPWRGIVS